MTLFRGLKYAAFAAAIAWSPLTRAQPVDDIVAFRDAVAAAIKAQAPTACVKVLNDITLNIGASTTDCNGTLAVENQYADVMRGGDRADAIARLARTAVATLSPEELSALDRPRIVVVLRPKDYGRGMPGGKPLELVSRPFAGDLMAVLMFDSAESLRGMTPPDLEKVGLTADTAFALAAENLRRRVGRVDNENVDDFEVIAADSGLATGLLALPEACDAKTPDRFFFVFNKNGYASVPMRNRAVARRFLTMADNMSASGESMSQTAIACQAGRWVAAKDVVFAD